MAPNPLDEYLRLLAQAGPDLEDRLVRSLCEGSLYEFLKEAWPAFDPAPFVGGWHLEAICTHLEAVSRGQIKRLIINIPPRHSKTSAVAIAWPVWTWAQALDANNPLIGPGVRFLCASYGASKAQQDGVTARRLIASRWFQKLWGSHVVISPTRDNQEEYDTLAGGYRISTGIPESLGKGGIIRLWDDPHKTDQVESEDVLASQIRAYNEVWRTRSNDPEQGAEVGIMQRLGKGDLSGYLLDNDEDIVHLCLPALFEADMPCRTVIGFCDPREYDEEPLWPERYNYDWYAKQRGRIGKFAWAGQYQQRPIPRGGGIIRREWWQAWPPDDDIQKWTNNQGQVAYPPWEFMLAYLDTAFTKKEENDWCAMSRLGVFGDSAGRPRVMLAGAWHDRLNFRELITKAAASCKAWKVDVLVIENKAGGIWVAEEIMKEMRNGEWQVVLDTPTVDKIARANAAVPLFTDKMIHAPFMHEAGVWRDWAETTIAEVEDFPRGTHDDLVDTVTGGLLYLRRNDMIKLSSEHDEDERDAKTFRGNREGVAGMYGVG